MIGISSSRRPTLALWLVALGGLALRVFPFFGPQGAWSYRVDYDEGVYFSAAASWLEGAWPYRDFVFAHPPGLLLFLATTSAWTKGWLGVAGAFALSRWLAALLGLANILMVGRLVWNLTSHGAAAMLAALLYAVYPEVVQVERGPFLEPLLNLVCLVIPWALQLASESGSAHRPAWLLLAGVCGGLALSIKLWAGVWILGALAGLLLLGERRAFVMFLRPLVIVSAVVVLPFALRAPGAFFEEAGLFHLWRPPDGISDRLDRLGQLFALRHLASPVLATIAVVVTAVRRETFAVIDRVVLVAWLLTFTGFLASSAYWAQYNAHLVASEAVLAGYALAAMLRPGPTRTRAAANVVLVLLVLVSVGVSVAQSVRRSESDGQHLALSRSTLASTPECVFTFEPGWSLAAGRLPPRVEGAPLVIDNYAEGLLGALRGGQRFPTVAEAFATAPLPAVVQQCRWVVLGDRGARQLSAAAKAELERTHRRVDVGGLEAWETTSPSP